MTDLKNNVVKASVIVFALSFIAKIVALLKTVIQASYFGATSSTDAFNVSNGFVSNILFMLTMAVSVAFVPLYIQKKETGDSYQFASSTVTFFSIVAVVVTILIFLFAPAITTLIAPSYKEGDRELTVLYLRIQAVSFVFSLGTNLYSNILNAEKKYGTAAFCSIINSIVLILGIPLFGAHLGVMVLVISVPVSFAFQWILLYVIGRQFGDFSQKIIDPSIKILLLQAIPILIGQATVEVNQVIDRALLSSVGEGVLTAISYSVVLYQFATTLINTPLQTVMFTELSEAAAQDSTERLKNILVSCYKISIFICVPIMGVILLVSGPIVRIVFGHGNFSAIEQCALGLRLYGLCLLPVCVKTIITRAYYSLNDTKCPMVIGTMEVIVNTILSILLAQKYGVLGIIGSTVFASYSFVIVLLIDFNKRHLSILNTRAVSGFRNYIIGAISCVIALWITTMYEINNDYINLVIRTLISFGTYVLVLLLTHDDLLYSIVKRFMQKR